LWGLGFHPRHSRLRPDRINKPAGTLIFTMTFWWRIARIPAATGKALNCATCKAAGVTSLTMMALCGAAEAAALRREFRAVLTRNRARTCARMATILKRVAQLQMVTGKVPSWTTTTNAAAKL
jgi:hypothetical protein